MRPPRRELPHPKDVRDRLYIAAELLDEQTFAQSAMFYDADGFVTDSEHACKFCMLGAVMIVCGLKHSRNMPSMATQMENYICTAARQLYEMPSIDVNDKLGLLAVHRTLRRAALLADLDAQGVAA